MNYEESDPRVLSRFFSEWEDYSTFNSMHAAPDEVRFHAFRAAWAWHEPGLKDRTGHPDPFPPPNPPEYQMLKDWLAAKSSGYWEPVGAK